MAESIFDDRNVVPNDRMLVKALGKAGKLYEGITDHLHAEYGELTREWKFYSKQSGWTMKTRKKKRNLFFLMPLKNHFKLTFVFGDKAVSVIEKSDLPAHIIESLRKARKYAEGRGIQIDVKSMKDVKNIIKLVAIKVDN